MQKSLMAVTCLSVLVGCNGTSTYGTGTSQEMQLVKDLSGLVSLKRSKQAKIAYEERPSLVRPGGKELPPPVETAAAPAGDGVSAFGILHGCASLRRRRPTQRNRIHDADRFHQHRR